MVSSFKLVGDLVGGGVQEFVNYADGLASLKRKLVGLSVQVNQNS